MKFVTESEKGKKVKFAINRFMYTYIQLYNIIHLLYYVLHDVTVLYYITVVLYYNLQ